MHRTSLNSLTENKGRHFLDGTIQNVTGFHRKSAHAEARGNAIGPFSAPHYYKYSSAKTLGNVAIQTDPKGNPSLR